MVVVAKGNIADTSWNPWPFGHQSAAHTWARHFWNRLPGYWDVNHESYEWEADHHGDASSTCDCDDKRLSSSSARCDYDSDTSTETEDSETEEEIKLRVAEEPNGFWISKLYLTNRDKWELLNGVMLSDKHIFAAQKLLALQFPHVKGFQDTCLAQTSFGPVIEDCVQIHHTRGNHWVVTSWVRGDIVEVYDSIYYNVPDDLLHQMEEIYIDAPRDTEGRLLYRMPAIQKQTGSQDCGLFTVALAFELCQKYDVIDIKLKQKDIRKHLYRCLKKGKITTFPMS